MGHDPLALVGEQEASGAVLATEVPGGAAAVAPSRRRDPERGQREFVILIGWWADQ